MIASILFDAEGVVIDTEGVWDHSQEEFLLRRGLTYHRDEVKPLLTGRSVEEGAAVLKRHYHLEGEVEDLARERIEITRRRLLEEVHFIPGFLEFYSQVRDRYRTCLATAMDGKLLDLADERLRLRELFGGRVFTLADVGFRSKPEPDLFLHAARSLGTPPAECVVIEDSPYGIEAARRAGMACIGFASTYRAELLQGADVVVAAYEEIDLAALTRRPQASATS